MNSMIEVDNDTETQLQREEQKFEALVHVMSSLAVQEYTTDVIGPWNKNWQTIMGRLKISLPLDLSVGEGMQTWRWRFNAADDSEKLFVVGKVFKHRLLKDELEIHSAAQTVVNQPVLAKKDDHPPILGVEAIRNPDKTYQYPRLDLLSRLASIVPDHLDDIEVCGLGAGIEVLRPFGGLLAGEGPIYRYNLLQNLSSPLSSAEDMGKMRSALYYGEVSADAGSIEDLLRGEYITPDIQNSNFARLDQVADFLRSDQVYYDVVGTKFF